MVGRKGSCRREIGQQLDGNLEVAGTIYIIMLSFAADLVACDVDVSPTMIPSLRKRHIIHILGTSRLRQSHNLFQEIKKLKK